MKWFFLLAIISIGTCLAKTIDDNHQEEVEDAENVDRNTLSQTTQSNEVMFANSGMNAGDLNIPGSLVQLLANGGAVAAGILVVAALALMVMPAFGVRACSIFGGCDSPSYQAYSTSPNSVYSDYQGYSQGGTYNNPVYQRRSLEYIGPILKALGNAYDKYNRAATPTVTKNA
ncbi:hypothetical protein O3M35_008772 [Rhynocoris fuscipes]|uniref:Uncharacterized protein n=1 Tax=Rhynocoris fuscipes TaxID=488301 RepID=A0AAW1DA56_9HEMI